VRLLLTGERSWRLLLLRHLLDLAATRPEAFGELPPAEAAWRELRIAEQASAQALDDVLMHPQVGIWLSSTIRALHAGRPGTPLWIEVGQVHALALAAAARAGATLTTRIPVHAGHALLPTLGMARFTTEAPCAIADAHTAGGHTVLRLGDERITLPDGPSWWQLRRLSAEVDGREIRVWLDDIDRYRNLADPVPPARLTSAEVERWAAQLDGAWRLLCREWPEYADALAAGFLSITPLPPDPDARFTQSASTGDGFGAAVISPPADATTLAVTLVHEFQHIKLGGLLHLVSLHDDERTDGLYAPWRDDPRPFGGLFQGVYAFLGIAMFWQRHADALSGRAAAPAHFEFAYARRQTREALHTLARSHRLTMPGRRFVDGMRAAMRALAAVRVPRDLDRAAWAAASDHRAIWRLRNRALPAHAVARLVDAWQAGDPAPGPAAELATPKKGDGRWCYARIALQRTRMSAPDRFAELAAEPGTVHRRVAGATPADLALVGGDPDLARRTYLRQLADDPDDVDSWAGLGLSLAATGQPGWRALLREPHVVVAVHRELRRRHAAADPIDVARWLAAGPALVTAGSAGGSTAGSDRRRSPRGGSAAR
jgi:HEXXH motif-containing protein